MNVGKREKPKSPFGQRIYEARTKAGLTQDEAAALIGISQSTLAGLESKGQGSAYTTVMGRVYKRDAHYLATGEEPGPGKPNRNFEEEFEPGDTDWGQLRKDLPFVPPAERARIIASIHATAEENRAHIDAMVKQLKKERKDAKE